MKSGARWLALALAALAGVVVAAVLIGPRLGGTSGSASALPSASASATPGSTLTLLPSPSSSPTPLPSPISLPIPSWNTDVGTLVLRLWMEAPNRAHVVTVLEDGHIISTSYPYGAPEGPFDGAHVERRLTAAGVQIFRDELDATGLTFSTSSDYFPAGPLDGTPSVLEVGLSGGGTVVIRWVSFGGSPEVEALRALAARLSTLDEWLPASAWADANGKPYAPTQYRISIESQQWTGSLDDLPVESTTASWPLIDGLDAYGDAVGIVAQGDGVMDPTPRCRVASVEEATAVIEALEAAGAAGNVPPSGILFSLGARASSRVVLITFDPILPLADTTCGAGIPI